MEKYKAKMEQRKLLVSSHVFLLMHVKTTRVEIHLDVARQPANHIISLRVIKRKFKNSKDKTQETRTKLKETLKMRQ